MELIIAFVFHCCYAVLILADCPPPSSVPNAAFLPNQTSYADGATVTFTCKDGYELDGRRIHTCRGSSWEGSLTCHEQFCETITTPRNGRIVGNPSYKIATYITFECNSGYTLNGRTQLLCRVDLKFDGNPPTCDVKMCPNFGVIDHARIFQATDGGIENDYGSVVKVTCEDTYVLDGPAHVVCQADGTWGSKPTCKPLDCGRFDGMNSGCVKNFILFETLYYMECETDVPNTRIGGPSTSTPNECKERSQQWEYSVFGCFCHCKMIYDNNTLTVETGNDPLPHGSVPKWWCNKDCTTNTTNPLKCNDGQEIKIPPCTCPNVTTVKPSPDDQTDNKSLMYGLIGGGAVGVFCCVCCCCFVCYKKKKRDKKKKRGTKKKEAPHPMTEPTDENHINKTDEKVTLSSENQKWQKGEPTEVKEKLLLENK